MSDENKLSLEQIKNAAHDLVSGGKDVRATLHKLTARALTQGQLAEQEIREVLGAITEGVSLGASERAEEVRSSLREALHGVDDALANAAEAMQLALGKAGANAKDFVEQDLKQGLDDLKKLEQMFLETLTRVAEGTSGLVKQELAALVEHARRAGTGTDARVKLVSEELANRLRATAHEASDTGRRAAREIGARVAATASGKLADIAEKLKRKAEALQQNK